MTMEAPGPGPRPRTGRGLQSGSPFMTSTLSRSWEREALARSVAQRNLLDVCGCACCSLVNRDCPHVVENSAGFTGEPKFRVWDGGGVNPVQMSDNM